MMSSKQSYLSDSHYGYDVVVATTQASINATMKLFLSKLKEPVARVCFIANKDGNPTLIDYDNLKQAAQGTDPFAVQPGADPNTNKDLQNLIKARFMAGFQAQLGLPPGYSDPTAIPDLVVLGTDTSKVQFNMLCSQFQIVELIPGGGYAPPTWNNFSQPDGAAWIIQSSVDLRLSVVDTSAYSKLPPDVRNAIKNIGGQTFSVRQLLLDLANAGLATPPHIEGVKPGTTAYHLLERYFVEAYFTEMQKGGQPLLCAAVTQQNAPISSLVMTDLNMKVSPFVGDNLLPVVNPTVAQQRLATLDYLCGTGGDVLPPATVFGWNWIDSNEQTDWHGVVSINRNTFSAWFKLQLIQYVERNCYLPHVRVWLSGILGTEVNYEWGLTAGQAPIIVQPPNGENVLSFIYGAQSYDQAGLNGDMGRLEFRTNYSMNVSFKDNTIVIAQHLMIWIYARGTFGVRSSGNVVDKTITDTYTLAVNAEGCLSAKQSYAILDISNSIDKDNFCNFWGGDINNLIDKVAEWTRSVAATNIEDIPLNVAQNFVFPGGRTFAFKSVCFSDKQDLIAHITYADQA
jgi:hypothetical protein